MIQLLKFDPTMVELYSHMTSEADLAKIARVSTGSQSKGAESDSKLISYLYTHKHTSPLEFVRFVFKIKAPIFIVRQWQRHRMGAYSEWSARYSELEPHFWSPDEWRKQSETRKQCSDGTLDWSNETIIKNCEATWQNYQEALLSGVSREQARVMLPINIYTTFYWSVDLHNLSHFLKLRIDSHAQPEIQVYSRRILELITPIMPTVAKLII
jgi:thymidylate synthase (FAD)